MSLQVKKSAETTKKEIIMKRKLDCDQLHRKRTVTGKCIRGAALVGLVATAFQAFEASATVSFNDLPDTSQLTQNVLLGNRFNLSNATINGPVAISPNGSIAVAGPSSINGDLFLATGATKTGPGAVNGTTFTGSDIYGTRNLPAGQAQVFIASSAFSSFPVDTLINGNVNSGQTFGSANGVNDVQVFTINGNLTLGSGQNINFTGDSGDVFVLNVTGGVNLTGSATIGTPGQAERTIINLTQSGNLGTIANVGNVFNGSVFIPNATTVTAHSVFGALYSGFGTVTLMSAATVTFVPFVPEPSTYLAAALMLLPLGVGTLRAVRKKSS
jgi:hypothetical protein